MSPDNELYIAGFVEGYTAVPLVNVQQLQTPEWERLDLRMKIAVSVYGTVVREIYPFELMCFGPQGTREVPKAAQPDRDGRYNIEGFKPGNYNINLSRINDSHELLEIKSFEVEAGERFPLDFGNDPRFTLRGVVLIDDLPMAGGTVLVAHHQSSYFGTCRAETGQDGRFQIETWPNGRYW